MSPGPGLWYGAHFSKDKCPVWIEPNGALLFRGDNQYLRCTGFVHSRNRSTPRTGLNDLKTRGRFEFDFGFQRIALSDLRRIALMDKSAGFHLTEINRHAAFSGYFFAYLLYL